MHTFLVFGGMDYYPSGGFDDLIGTQDTLEKAKLLGEVFLKFVDEVDWYQVVDLTTFEVVHRSYDDGYPDVTSISFLNRKAVASQTLYRYGKRQTQPVPREERVAQYLENYPRSDSWFTKVTLCNSTLAADVNTTVRYFTGPYLSSDIPDLVRHLVGIGVITDTHGLVEFTLLRELPEGTEASGSFENFFTLAMRTVKDSGATSRPEPGDTVNVRIDGREVSAGIKDGGTLYLLNPTNLFSNKYT